MSFQTQSFNPLIQRIGLVRSYPRKSEVVGEGDPATRVCEVISGTVCRYKMLREGRRQIAGFYFAGDAFGLESAEKHNVAAQAITNAEVRVIKKQALIALAASNREVANQLLTLTTRELARKQDLVLLLSRIPVTGISLAHAPDATLKDFSHDVLRGIATSPPTRPPPV